ncbi:hypothetical protein EDL81_02170 [Ehrlichia ruminantium]|uniref:ankyrin repeat domain-containing protein n=1 Tax=Ehrlichia ruminantium TaxID=779 RepID=UPI00130EC2D1|nr:ankyrin repeat domain-containing protein [Ehrlichia ruminantium]QGR02467.1 hypothetical protein EDL81_02170 [Ehrlichia ruminantium]
MGIEDLHQAIKAEDISEVKKIFKSSNKAEKARLVCSETENGQGILQYVISEYLATRKIEYADIFQEIFKHCDNNLLNKRDSNGEYPLLRAARAGSLFLHLFDSSKKKIDWNVCDREGNGVLLNGISSGDTGCINIIMHRKDAHSQLSRVNNNGDNVLHTVINQCIASGSHIGRYDTILGKLSRLVVEHKKSALGQQFALGRLLNLPNKSGNTPAHLLVKSPQVFLDPDYPHTESLIENIDVGKLDSQGNSVLDLAVQNNTAGEIIKMILTNEDQYQMKELKKTLLKHVTEQNYGTILTGYRREKLTEILRDVDLKDPELSRVLVDRFKHVKTRDEVDNFNNVVIDNNIFTEQDACCCAIESENPVACRYYEHYEPYMNNSKCQKAVSKVQGDELIRLIVSRNPYNIVGFSEKHLSPKLILAVLDGDDVNAAVAMVKRLSQSSRLLESFIKNTSDAQLVSCMLKIGVEGSLRRQVCSMEINDADFEVIAQDMNKVCQASEDRIFSLAQKGDIENLVKWIKCDIDLIYKEKDGKSLLEIASDNGHRDLVKALISLHNKNIVSAIGYLGHDPIAHVKIANSFNHISKIPSQEAFEVIQNNKDLIDPDIIRTIFNNAIIAGGSDELIQFCYENYYENIKDIRYMKPQVSEEHDGKETGKPMPSSGIASGEKEGKSSTDILSLRDKINQYGALSGYVDAILSRDADRFKQEVIDKLNDNPKDYITKSQGSEGHTIFSLVASFGSTEQWTKLSDAYKSVALTKKTRSIFPKDPLNGNKTSSLGSPLQCAIIADNIPVAEFFLQKINSDELSAGYGKYNENVIHTAVRHGKLDILRKIISDDKFPKASLVKAFLHPNKDGITPFTMAFQEGYGRLCREFIKVIKESQDSSVYRQVLLDENLLKLVIDYGDTNLFNDIIDIQRHVNTSKTRSTIHLVNHNIGRDNLLSYTCKNAEIKLLEVLIKCCEIEDIFHALEGVIRESSNINPEALDTLFAHLVKCSSEERVASAIIPLVVKYDKPEVLERVANAININDPRFNVRNLIVQNKPDVLSYILNARSGGLDVTTSSGGMNDLAFAMCSPNMSRVCCDYLQSHPDVELRNGALFYAAILSNNIELVDLLIKKDPSLAMKECDTSSKQNKEVLSKLKSEYKCKFTDGELPYAFAERTPSVSLQMKSYLKDAFLKRCEQNAVTASDFLVNNNLIKTLASCSNPAKYPDLCKKIVQCVDVGDFLSRSYTSGDNVFHLADGKNVDFLSKLAAKCRVFVKDSGNPKHKSMFKSMVNKTRPSDGLSFFHFLAANSFFEDYKSLCLSQGDVKQLTSDGANMSHICARSGMKDESGRFEFENLIDNERDLRGAVDRRGNGLLAYAASGSNEDLALEAVTKIISSPGLDPNLNKMFKYTQRKYIQKCLNAAFDSGNIKVYKSICEKFGIKGLVPSLHDMHRGLLTKISSTTDPVKAAKLLSDEYDRYVESGKSPAELSGQQQDNETLQDRIFVNPSKKVILDSSYKLADLLDTDAGYEKCLSEINRASSGALQIRISGGQSVAEKAISSGNAAFVKALAASNVTLNPNITDDNGNTLLHRLILACNEHPQLLQDIVMIGNELAYRNGFSVNQKNIDGETPISLLESLKEKLEKEGSENLYLIQELLTILPVRSGQESSEVQKLNSASEIYNITGSSRKLSLEMTHSDFLSKQFNQVLYGACAAILSDDSIKHPSAGNRNAEKLKKLLVDSDIRKTLTNTDSQGNNILQAIFENVATGKLNSDEVGLLQLVNIILSSIKDGKDRDLLDDLLLNHRNSRGENAIESLAKIPPAYPVFKRLEELLGKEKISNRSDFNTVLVNSAASGNVQLYDYICTKYAVDTLRNVDIHGESSLHKAVVNGSVEMVKRVLATGSDINRKNREGNTPLHSLLLHISNAPDHMVKPEHIQLVRFLISRGASLSEKNISGVSPSNIAPSIVSRSESESKLPEDTCNVLQHMRDGRNDYLDLNKECDVLKNHVKWYGIAPEFSVLGGIISAKVDDGKIRSSDLLKSEFCKKYSLATVKFNLSDVDKGYIQNVGDKRNYIVEEGSIKLKLSWKPTGKNAKKQTVTVIINSDGRVSLQASDIEKCGEHGEKLDFDNCKVYVGGLCLKDALANGRWRDKKAVSSSKEHTSQDKSPEQAKGPDLDDPDLGSEVAESYSEDKKLDPRSGLDPSVDSGPRFDPSVGLGSKLDSSLDSRSRLDPSVGLGSKLDPSLDSGSRLDPSLDFGSKLDPSVGLGSKLDSSLDPRSKDSKLGLSGDYSGIPQDPSSRRRRYDSYSSDVSSELTDFMQFSPSGDTRYPGLDDPEFFELQKFGAVGGYDRPKPELFVQDEFVDEGQPRRRDDGDLRKAQRGVMHQQHSDKTQGSSDGVKPIWDIDLSGFAKSLRTLDDVFGESSFEDIHGTPGDGESLPVVKTSSTKQMTGDQLSVGVTAVSDGVQTPSDSKPSQVVMQATGGVEDKAIGHDGMSIDVASVAKTGPLVEDSLGTTSDMRTGQGLSTSALADTVEASSTTEDIHSDGQNVADKSGTSDDIPSQVVIQATGGVEDKAIGRDGMSIDVASVAKTGPLVEDSLGTTSDMRTDQGLSISALADTVEASSTTEDIHSDDQHVTGKSGISEVKNMKKMLSRAHSESDVSNITMDPNMLQEIRKNLKRTESSHILTEPAQQDIYEEPREKAEKDVVLFVGLQPKHVEGMKSHDTADKSENIRKIDYMKKRSSSCSDISSVGMDNDIQRAKHNTFSGSIELIPADYRKALLHVSRAGYAEQVCESFEDLVKQNASERVSEGMASLDDGILQDEQVSTPSSNVYPDPVRQKVEKLAEGLQGVEPADQSITSPSVPSSPGIKQKTGSSKSM